MLKDKRLKGREYRDVSVCKQLVYFSTLLLWHHSVESIIKSQKVIAFAQIHMQTFYAEVIVANVTSITYCTARNVNKCLYDRVDANHQLYDMN